ncbi:metallophosphoesterase [Candidatus Bathyarchaeota archaeon]|nr:MAG: metallophosphoesterase [Candidatus Bathyarchaeota archaeon]
MIIGLVSDTHDNVPYIKKAITRLKEEHVELVLHAGDYIAPFTAKPYSELDVPLIGVFGNNCAETDALRRVYAEVGCDIRGYFTEVEADGLRIALLHGHRKEDLDRAFSGGFDVIVRGHTHRSSISHENDILVINPGEVCGYVSGINSICFLDTEKRFAWLSELL